MVNERVMKGIAGKKIVVLHRDSAVQRRLKVLLQALKCHIFPAATIPEAMATIHRESPDLLFLAVDQPVYGGARVVDVMREQGRGIPVIAFASTQSIGDAVEAMRRGAVDYITAEAKYSVWLEVVERALLEAKMSREVESVKRDVQDRYGFSQLLTRSPKMLRVFDDVRAVATTDATVLILGETGTGKELISRAIASRSRRAEKPFISVNCGAFTETLLESELFGHEKGSFTGAAGRQVGLFEMADGGTLFLDELGETSQNVQVNLLRVLETMTFRRVGGREETTVDVRILAATHVHLDQAVAKGKFREDLYYRLNVFPIHLPPLRQRPEDIPLLMRHFLDQIGRDYDVDPPVISTEALDAIMAYKWPGNVRQLRALCERWVIGRGGGRLEVENLPSEMTGAPGTNHQFSSTYIDEAQSLPKNLSRVTRELERAYLTRVLTKTRGRVEESAKIAGISRRTLYTKLKHYDLDALDFRKPN